MRLEEMVGINKSIMNCNVNYHLGKAYVVADALSRKEKLKQMIESKELIKEFEKLELEVCTTEATSGIKCM